MDFNMNFRERFNARARAIDAKATATREPITGKHVRLWEVLKIREREGVKEMLLVMVGLTEKEALQALARLSRKPKDGVSYDIAPSEF